MSSRRAGIPFAFIIALLFMAYIVANKQAVNVSKLTPTSTISASSTLDTQTKTANCLPVGPLPDHACTPGAIILTATKDQICTPGYSKGVRNVPESEKQAVYAEYGIVSHTKGQYEVDHLISLELGGSNDIANLWPEPAEPTPGFHQKDGVENTLHSQVCSGAISLVDAQRIIATNWLASTSDATLGTNGMSAIIDGRP